MKILEHQSAVLSNAEVLNHLQQIQTRRQAQAGRWVPPLKSPNFETVVKELTAYLHPPRSEGSDEDDTNRCPLPDYARDYDASAIRRCVEQLEPYRLTKAELLMLLNLRPTEGDQLDAIIEEMEKRFSPAQLQEILAILASTLVRGGGWSDGRNGGAGNAEQRR